MRQVVHHVPDSHMNAYMRFKLALTEDLPLIKPYNEAKWAELGDVKSAAIEPSLALLENLHKRWVLLLRTLARRSGRGNFAIRSGKSPCRWTIRLRCTRGTENITWPTSRHCANARDGASAAPVSERAKRISRSCTSTQRSQ